MSRDRGDSRRRNSRDRTPEKSNSQPEKATEVPVRQLDTIPLPAYGNYDVFISRILI